MSINSKFNFNKNFVIPKNDIFPMKLLGLLFILSIFWGLNWPVMKLGIQEIPVLTFRGTACIFGAIGLFIIAKMGKVKISFPKNETKRLCAISFFNVFLWNILVTTGLSHLDSGKTAVVAYTMPLWVVFLSIFVLQEKLTNYRLLGLSLGATGIGLLISDDLVLDVENLTGTCLALAAAVSWAIGTVLMKRYPVSLGTTSFVAWQLLLGGLPIFGGALILEYTNPWTWSLLASMCLLYNTLVAMIFCHWAWYKIATNTAAGVAALSTLMIPIIGVFSGMIMLDETPGWREFCALSMVTLAIGSVLLPTLSTFFKSETKN